MGKYEYILSINEIALLKGLVELLEVFNIFTVFIQGNQYPTMNTMALFCTEIENSLEKINTFNSNETIENTAHILKENLPKRIEVLNEYIAAALIDSRIQHLEIVNRWMSEKGMNLFEFFSAQFSIFKFLSIELKNVNIFFC